MSEREATITPSVNSLMPKALPRGITWREVSWAAAAAALSSWWANSFPPLKMEASKALGSLPSERNPRQPNMHKAVAPTLSAKSFTALAAAPLFHCFQKAFIRVHPFLGRGVRKKCFRARDYSATRCGIYFDN